MFWSDLRAKWADDAIALVDAKDLCIMCPQTHRQGGPCEVAALDPRTCFRRAVTCEGRM